MNDTQKAIRLISVEYEELLVSLRKDMRKRLEDVLDDYKDDADIPDADIIARVTFRAALKEHLKSTSRDYGLVTQVRRGHL